MDFHTLDTMIAERAREQADRVLLQACQNVGECTYSKFEPSYRKSINLLVTFYHEFYPKQIDDVLANPKFKQTLIANVVFYYQSMYRQPCLICEACRNRISTWCQSDLDNFENLLWYLDQELASTLRSPIYDSIPIPEWIAEWLHAMFWDRWVRGVFWKPSESESPVHHTL